jgi:tetratricopeptide (TPR) repeat protein
MRRSKLALWALSILALAVPACNAPFDLSPAALFATATATPTATPQPTPTPTPTPPPTPTPTPDPAEWLSDAARAMQDGDYATAAETYRRLLGLALDEDTAADARLNLGTAYLRDGDYSNGVDAFRAFLAVDSGSHLAPDVHFLLGEALAGAGEPLAAADEYRAYLSAGTLRQPGTGGCPQRGRRLPACDRSLRGRGCRCPRPLLRGRRAREAGAHPRRPAGLPRRRRSIRRDS